MSIEYYLLLIPLGFAVGTYGTLIGAGGGFILIPLLLFLYPTEDIRIITSISLAVIFCNAFSGTIAYGRMGRIDYKSGLLLAAATVPGAVVGVLTTDFLPRQLFNILLGVMMVGGALFIFISPVRRESKKKNPIHAGFSRRIVEKDGSEHRFAYNLPLGVGVSGITGYISSLFGIGGGIIHVPLLSRALHFPVHVATATSHFVLAIMALTATIVNIAGGEFQHGFWRTVCLSVGVLLGAQVGARLSNKIKGPWIIRALALALAIVGVRLIITV